MNTKYKDLTIWITGASSGIGAALAIAFAKQGARIILSGRNEEKLEAVKKRCKRANKHIILPFDISDANQATAAYFSVKEKAGKIDWLINNAGVSQRSLIMETTEEVEHRIMEIDYFAQTRLTRLVLPDMLAQGRKNSDDIQRSRPIRYPISWCLWGSQSCHSYVGKQSAC